MTLVEDDFSSVPLPGGEGVGKEVCGVVSWTPSGDFFFVFAFPLENVLVLESPLENIFVASLMSVSFGQYLHTFLVCLVTSSSEQS